MLDSSCSIKVYEGRYDDLLHFTYTSVDPNEITEYLNQHFLLLFSTPEKVSLNGKCFAVLDGDGYLHILRGHPSNERTIKDIWISNKLYSSSKDDNNDNDPYNRYYNTKQYFLSLSDDSTLSILSGTYGRYSNIEPQCIWSTSACSKEFAIFKIQKARLGRNIKQIYYNLKDNILSLDEYIDFTKSYISKMIKNIQRKGLYNIINSTINQLKYKFLLFFNNNNFQDYFDNSKDFILDKMYTGLNFIARQTREFWDDTHDTSNNYDSSYRRRKSRYEYNSRGGNYYHRY
jgi:hypothetical protein